MRLSSLLAVALLAFSAVLGVFLPVHPLAAAERQVVTTDNSDYFGFDLRTVKDVTLDACSAACSNDGSCRAFTYNKKAKWCFLKSDFNQLNPAPGAIAGKVVDGNGGEDLGAAPALPFVSDQLRRDAEQMRRDLALAEDQKDQGVESLAALARIEAGNGQDELTVTALTGALAIDPDNAALWIERARIDRRMATDSTYAVQAALAALNGYRLSRDAGTRADALAALAEALDKAQDFRTALHAYKASLALSDTRSVRLAYEDLRARQGFRVVDHSIDSDAADPRACVQFSEPLLRNGVDYTPFVTLNGKAPQAIEARDNQLCVEGLSHGSRYTLALRAGLPSSVDEDLPAAVSLDIYVRDRSAAARFTGENFVLPSAMRRGIPIVTVNTDSVDLTLYRIGDRAIAGLLANSQFLTQMDTYTAAQLEQTAAEKIWSGALEIRNETNKEVVTSFPVDEALPKRAPGIYVLTARAPQSKLQDWDPKATQWFLVSDIGLSTYTGTDGLSVFARSLASAKPLEGVTLELIARNNDVLGTAVTDSSGRAVFAAGLARGRDAMAPAVIMARGAEGDFVFLDMTRAGFDLSDRGVTGRTAPGAIDVFAYTERGIYRAGETVHAAALTRDSAGNAIEGLPLTFVFTRPDGVEDRRIVSRDAGLGGHSVDFDVQSNAMLGTWTLGIFTDPKGNAIAEQRFLVDDFVPDRTEFDLTAASDSIVPAAPPALAIAGRYLYGAPASGLALEGDVRVKPVRERPDTPGYQFGLADEDDSQIAELPLDGLPALDEDGKASLDLVLPDLPATSRALSAEIRVRMRESGGRAVERSLTLPIRAEGPMIGIKPEFDGSVKENSAAGFSIVAVDPDGKKIALAGTRWTLTRIERTYQWYRDGNSWRFEPVTSATKLDNGTLALGPEGGKLSLPVSWGRYRLDVESAEAGGPASSVEFDAGWFVEARSTETPDALEIALDKQSYTVGDTARLTVSARYAGHLQVIAGTETVLSVSEADLAESGGTIDVPVTGDWGAGTYLTATLYRPGDSVESRMPIRSIGIKWASVDPGPRKLAVTLDLPEKIRPVSTLAIPVSLAGATAGEDAYVTVAAVDVGILNLTRYAAPDPEGWYFGQRQLGLELRDLYGRLIDGSLGAGGRLRTGGDGGQVALEGNPPTEKLVAFFSGPVKLDEQGKAVVSFDIPQFNGTARVMAVAWSKTGIGHAEKDVIIRDPLVVTASLPKFLSPGDKAELRLDLVNTDAPAGDYRLSLSASDGVSLEGETQRTVTLEAGARKSITLPLTATAAGTAAIALSLEGAGDMALTQTLSLPVRSGALPQTVRRPVTLGPGQSVTVDRELLSGSELAGASVSVSLTRSPAFDIASLLMVLDRYPYGCAEQTTSRALPLLYVRALEKAAGLPQDPDTAKKIDEAVKRVLSYQSSTGSFGLWAPGSGDLWLDSYVTDFLSRAREEKVAVPDEAMVLALQNLENAVGYDQNVAERGNEIAYALYVLARNKRAAISDLRYYADTQKEAFQTPLARAHIAAALALYGDVPRAKDMFESAAALAEASRDASLVRSDYGSALRDGAALLTLAAESRPQPPVIDSLTRNVATQVESKRETSTQEQAWTLLAARAVKQSDAEIRADVDGTAAEGPFSATLTGDQVLERPMTVTNRSAGPVTAMVTTVAAPEQPLPAGGEGYTIDRSYYTLDGEPVEISTASQNSRYVVVLTVHQDNDWPARILVTDMLPAGFQIDNPALVNSASLANFDWLGETEATHTEFRSDRFVAALDRAQGVAQDFTLAYVVRAVTPGIYSHPAAVVEDMYRPQLAARTATGMVAVEAP